MRKEVPLLITFTIGLFMILSFFIPHPYVNDVATKFKDWFIVISSFAIVLGISNLIRVNVHRIQKRSEDWGYKIVTLVALALMLTACLAFNYKKEFHSYWLTEALGVAGSEGNPGKWAYDAFYVPLQATMFSLLAFYIASAAYRAFRVRSLEAGLLLGAAMLVMLGRVPMFQFEIYNGFHLGKVSDWILNNPNTAAKRAVLMGAAMGVVSMNLKIILGLERAYLGGE